MSAFGRPQQQQNMGMQMPVQQRIQIPPVMPPRPMDEIPRPEMFNPQYDAQNRFAGLLDQMPQPNKAGMWTKLGASLAGMGSQNPYQTAMSIQQAPYLNQLAEWKMKAPFMQQAADNERLTNTQGLTYNNQQMTQRINQQKADTQQAAAESKATTDKMNAESRRLRDEAYAFAQKNPNWVAMKNKGGTVVYVNPQNPAEMYDTGVDSGTLTDRDAINMRVQGQLDVADANNAAALGRVNAQQAGATERTRMTVEGANDRDTNNWQILQDASGKSYRYNPATNEVQPVEGLPTGTLTRPAAPRSAGTGSSITPASVATDRINKAGEVLRARPDLSAYVTVQGRNVNVADADKPGAVRGFFGGTSKFDETTRKAIVDYIEGKPGAQIPIVTTTPIVNTPGMPALPAGSTTTAKTSGTGPAQVPAGKVLVISPTGQEGYIPAGQVEAALAQGYRRK